MQFTYTEETTGIIHKLFFIADNSLLTTYTVNQYSLNKEIQVSDLIDYLKSKSLAIQNFPGLTEYLESDYCYLLRRDPHYILKNLVRDLENYYSIRELKDSIFEYQYAKDYLNNNI